MAHVFWNRLHNDPSRSSKVVDLVTYFSSVVTSNRGRIVRVSEILELVYAEKPLSQYFTPIPATISDFEFSAKFHLE